MTTPDRQTTPDEQPEKCFYCFELTDKHDIETSKGVICERCFNQSGCRESEMEDYVEGLI
jgi:hypothetical protein